MDANDDGLLNVHTWNLVQVSSHLPNPDRIHFAEYGFHSLFSAFARIHHNYSPTKDWKVVQEGEGERDRRMAIQF